MEQQTQLKQTGIRVNLAPAEGNAFAMTGLVWRALCQAGYGEDFVSAFFDDAVSKDFQHLLTVINNTVIVDWQETV